MLRIPVTVWNQEYHVTFFSIGVSMVTFWNLASGSWQYDGGYIHVEVINFTAGPKLEVVRLSSTGGYIQTPGWSYSSLHPKHMDSVVRVEVPEMHAAMITMRHMNLTGRRFKCDVSKVTLAVYEGNMTTKVWQCLALTDQGFNTEQGARVARTGLSPGADLYVRFWCGKFQKVGFRLYFSVHEESALLRGGSDGLWNCSVPNFADFKPHFPCDLYPQCVDKEDERDCPYFSEECGLGFVTLGGRCLLYQNDPRRGTWREMEFICQTLGGRLANFRKWEDYATFMQYLNPVVDVWGFYRIIVGLHSASMSLPMMYRQEFQHSDETIAFSRSTDTVSSISTVCGSIILKWGEKTYLKHLTLSYCTKRLAQIGTRILCEMPKGSTAETRPVPQKIQIVSASNTHPSLPLVGCASGHVTRDFLACDAESTCWSRGENSCLAPLMPLPPSFECANGFESVPYSLVCDARPDCKDGSDESFCHFPPCELPEPFYCSDRECVPRSTICDRQRNCYNGIDEDLCSSDTRITTIRPAPPAIVNLNHQGQFVVHKMTQSRLADLILAVCPETHFKCPDDGYCMPVFLRCNGVYDCLGREDEADCNSYTCPGFYRCRGSQICVHPEHLCDDIFQCPRNDDELLCDVICPEHCTCYGLAFFCRRSFQATNFTKLRFLDGRASGINVSDLTKNALLIYLSIAANRLTAVGRLNFSNLCTLDLSDNNLHEIRLRDLSLLPQVQSLILSGNPLQFLFRTVDRIDLNGMSQSTSSLTDISESPEVIFHTTSDGTLSNMLSFQDDKSERVKLSPTDSTEGTDAIFSLHTLDLSRVKFEVLNTSFLSLLPNLHTVNMSGGGVDTLLGEGFQALTQLRALDLRGCPLTYFPRDVFRGLEQLETVYSDNYKLCCAATLPASFVLKNCHAPSDEISSCEALLRADSYRVSLSLFALLSLLGNTGSFIYRVFLQKRSRFLGFDVFVAHLCVADFLMGVYLSIIGMADRLYQGTYLWEDNTWKSSTACRMAGFLSLMSSEVSALVICLITIDRFLVLRFPFSTFHFGARSAQMASLSVWAVGCLIAALPLIPTDWQFYSQTGICIPLPIRKADSPSYTYAFAVMIVANFVFFIVIAAGQVFIYWSVYANSLSSSQTTKKTQDLTIARRLITVAMSDFLCWFPIGLLGIMAATGTPISGEVNVAMAIFVLPFNSALNPFLYTLNVVLEKRRKAGEERIKKRLMAEIRNANTADKASCPENSFITKRVIPCTCNSP